MTNADVEEISQKFAEMGVAIPGPPAGCRMIRLDVGSAAVHDGYLFVPHQERGITLAYLCNEIRAADQTVAIFTRTAPETDWVANLLGRLGIGAISLHVGLSPSARVAALNSRVIVTTDAAACVIPLLKADYIINFDLTSCSWKMNPETYTQRIRNVVFAGGLCHAITFVTQYDIQCFMRLKRVLGISLESCTLDENRVMTFKARVEKAYAELRAESKPELY